MRVARTRAFGGLEARSARHPVTEGVGGRSYHRYPVVEEATMNIGRPLREEPLVVPDHELIPDPMQAPAEPIPEPVPAEPTRP